MSNKTIQKAGILLINDNTNKSSNEYQDAMNTLSEFRNKHITSLDKVSAEVYKCSQTIDKNVIVAKRLKRTPSIINKLVRFPKMKLNRMQDIGGCRAILSSEKKVQKVKNKLKKLGYEVRNDYIKKPKNDGYRGIHLINKNHSYPIEVQLRTSIQHSWATAVEIVDLFENQHLKTKIENTNNQHIDWVDFFVHVSSEFSIIENYKQAREYPLEETVRLIERFDIIRKFLAYSESLKNLDEHIQKNNLDHYNLIRIDLFKASLSIQSFKKSEEKEATSKYLQSEKEALRDSFLIIALVSTESINNLKLAYPNYFADSEIFIQNIQRIQKSFEVQKAQQQNQGISNYLSKILFNK